MNDPVHPWLQKAYADARRAMREMKSEGMERFGIFTLQSYMGRRWLGVPNLTERLYRMVEEHQIPLGVESDEDGWRFVQRIEVGKLSPRTRIVYTTHLGLFRLGTVYKHTSRNTVINFDGVQHPDGPIAPLRRKVPHSTLVRRLKQ